MISDAGMVWPVASLTRRLAINARVPSGVMATANGSRPAEGRPNSCNGETESTEMSSDMELATTRRSPAAVRQKATATGAMPTGIEPVSLKVCVSSTASRSPSRQVTKRFFPAVSRASPNGRPATLTRRRTCREAVSASATSIAVVEGDVNFLSVRRNREPGGRVVMRPGLGPAQPVGGNEVTVETGYFRKILLMRHAQHVVGPIILPEPERHAGEARQNQQNDQDAFFHQLDFVGAGPAFFRPRLVMGTLTARGR